jgi:hypothetical protein
VILSWVKGRPTESRFLVSVRGLSGWGKGGRRNVERVGEVGKLDEAWATTVPVWTRIGSKSRGNNHIISFTILSVCEHADKGRERSERAQNEIHSRNCQFNSAEIQTRDDERKVVQSTSNHLLIQYKVCIRNLLIGPNATLTLTRHSRPTFGCVFLPNYAIDHERYSADKRRPYL